MKFSNYLPWIVVVLAGLLLVLYFTSREYETIEVEVGFQGAARHNRFLAAERFLEEMGLPAESLPLLSSVPPEGYLLLMNAADSSLQGELSTQLLEWVERGGHLVLGVSTPPFRGGVEEDEEEEELYERPAPAWIQNPLLDALGVTVDTWSNPDEFSVQVVKHSTSSEELDVAFPVSYSLADTDQLAHLIVGPRDLADLLQFRRGAGLVTVLSGSDCLTNLRIGDHDHARFLLELAHSPNPREGAWLAYGGQRGFLSLLMDRAWMLLVAAGLWLALWLWRNGSRFGPIVLRAPVSRRDFSEHVVATGSFLWKHQRSEDLLDAVRRRLTREIERRRPDLHGLDDEHLADHFADRTDLGRERCQGALVLSETRDPQRFTRVVNDLETMRKSL